MQKPVFGPSRTCAFSEEIFFPLSFFYIAVLTNACLDAGCRSARKHQGAFRQHLEPKQRYLLRLLTEAVLLSRYSLLYLQWIGIQLQLHERSNHRDVKW